MKGQRAIELTPHAKLRLEQRVKHPEGYPDWKSFATAARNKGKKLSQLDYGDKYCWKMYHSRGRQAGTPYFFKGYCFIFRTSHKVATLITVYKHTIHEKEKGENNDR